MRRYKHLLIKVLLILIAESIAMAVNWGFSTFIHPVKHTLHVNVILGAILAVAVVWLYNRQLNRRKQQVEKELKDLTDVVLKKIPDKENNNK